MVELLTAGPNLPFTIALAVMVAIALIEAIGALMGMGISGLLDSLLPDTDVDLDLNPSFFGWLPIGQVPAMVLVVIFLTAFGLMGLLLQALAVQVAGHSLPALLASALALIASVPILILLARGLARILPREETSAVSEETFIGKMATITLGTARAGQPAQAKLRDAFGQTHYAMVEPEVDGEALETGAEIVLVERDGAVFRVIRWE